MYIIFEGTLNVTRQS